jgi:hypothetical protein
MRLNAGLTARGNRFTLDTVLKLEFCVGLLGLARTKSLVGVDALYFGCFQNATPPVTIGGQIYIGGNDGRFVSKRVTA